MTITKKNEMPPKVLLFIPMYNCALQVGRVISSLKKSEVYKNFDHILCVDNGSSDETIGRAIEALEKLPVIEATILRNNGNYGLGGSHKVAINYAIENHYTHLVVLHGDDQGDILDILPILEDGSYKIVDFVMGARFMKRSRLEGYSLIRTLANRAFNLIFSVISGRRLYDLGSGLNIFKLSAFQDRWHMRLADDLTFNYHLILEIVHRRLELKFFPLRWREDDQISNAKLSKMGLQLLEIVGTRIFKKNKFFTMDWRLDPTCSYESTKVFTRG